MQTKNRILIAMFALAAASPVLADDMFLKLDGIPGDSADPQHTGEIALSSFSFGVEAESSWTKGGGASVGKPNPGELRFTALMDSSIAGMFRKITEGRSIATATLTVRTDGKGNRTSEYLRYTLTGMFITSIGQGLSGAGRAAMAVSGVHKTFKVEVLAGDGRLLSCTSWDIPTGVVEDCAASNR